jgi:hypothetical protein
MMDLSFPLLTPILIDAGKCEGSSFQVPHLRKEYPEGQAWE